MSDYPDDRELLARLHAADPAQRTPAPPSNWISDLTETTMIKPDTDENRPDQRGGRTWILVAAAAVVVATLGVGGVVALNNGDDKAPTAAAPSVTKLEAPAKSSGLCAVPDSGTLAQFADTAVDGVVVSVKGDQVTLDVSHWYAGEPTDTVQVTAPSADLSTLLGSADLEQGVRYLLSGTDDGQLMICGYSGRYDPKLAALFDKAFVK